MYDNINIKELISFIREDITKEDAKAIGISKSKIDKLKKKQNYIWRMRFKDIIKLNDYRIEKKIQKKNVEYVGIDIGVSHTLTASDKDMKRTLIIENKRIRNATKVYNKSLNNKDATTENIENSKEMLIRTIETNVTKLINQLLNHYFEPVTFIIGEVYQSKEDVRPHYELYRIFISEIKKRTENLDINIVNINESSTSIICPNCHYIDKKNRKKDNSFECKKCEFVHDNDDVVASANIVERYLQSQETR